jgi:biotin carboxyl carrier protein
VIRVIRINGAAVEPAGPDDADIVETEPGIYSVIAGSESWEARVCRNEIFIGGARFTFEIDDPRQWKRSTHSAGSHEHASIAAAMPGKIVRVLVSVGDEVVAGQGLLVIEAMKMQNELKSPRDGRVTTVEVKQNDGVTAGALLITIE